MLLAILTNNIEALTNEGKTELIKNFIYISNKFLTLCYNPELLKNEETIVCIPTFHLFSWYLVKAESKKTERIRRIFIVLFLHLCYNESYHRKNGVGHLNDTAQIYFNYNKKTEVVNRACQGKSYKN